jgi:hypothetical protein
MASTLIVEDGTGKPKADAYVSTADVAAYALANGQVWAPESEALGDAAVRVATRYLDGTYRWAYSGMRKRQRDQGLEWPRINAVAMLNYPIADNEVPRELQDATCEAAIREVAAPGTLSPDIQSSTITSITADSVSVSFGAGGYTGSQSFASIDLMLAPILQQTNSLSGRVGRG